MVKNIEVGNRMFSIPLVKITLLTGVIIGTYKLINSSQGQEESEDLLAGVEENVTEESCF